MRFSNTAGGRNRTHGQVEQVPRIDSFEAGRLWGSGGLYCVPQKAVDGDTILGCSWRLLDAHRGRIDRLEVYIPGCGPVALKLSHIRNGYGGQRTFFLCPECGERVRYLYLSESRLRCRKCAQLNYKSQQQTRDTEAYFDQGMAYLGSHLAPPPWPLDGLDFQHYVPPRPRYMHQATYQHRLARFSRYQHLREKLLTAQLARLLR